MIASQKFERRLLQLILIGLDVLGLLSAFVLALVVRFQNFNLGRFASYLLNDYRFYTILCVLVFANYIFDLYEPRHWRSRIFAPLKIVMATLTAVFVTLAWMYLLYSQTEGVVGRGVFIGGMTGYMALSFIFRYFADIRMKKEESRLSWILIGSKQSYENLISDLKRVRIDGQVLWLDRENIGQNLKVLDEKLAQGCSALIIDGALDKISTKKLMHVRVQGHVVLSLQSFYEFYCGKIPVHSLDDSWFAFTEGFSIIHSQTSSRLKRLSDILISSILLVITSPLFALCFVVVRLESRGGSLYSQIRVGQGGKKFVMWKFRSMRQDAEAQGPQYASEKDTRVTLFGRVMRKTRLDEIPQLWNILKGDMSFIGPRPERPNFVDHLAEKIPFYEFRHLVKPGLTGWAQVLYPYGANDEDSLEKLQYDLFYIKNHSFELDVEIIMKTISVVLFGAGR